MKKTNVVELASVKELLAELDVIRKHVLSGKVAGWLGTLQDHDGTETVYLGGVYGRSSKERLSAVLKMSAARMEREEEAPPVAHRKH